MIEMQSLRSGGAEGNRTPDLCSAIAVEVAAVEQNHGLALGKQPEQDKNLGQSADPKWTQPARLPSLNGGAA